MATKLVEVGFELEAKETEQDTLQRMQAVRLLAKCAFAISVFYVGVQISLGVVPAALFNLFFVFFFGTLVQLKKPHHVRMGGIAVMCGVFIQISGATLLFLPQDSGTHFFFALVPIFSLIAIHPSDRLWLYSLACLSVFLIGVVESLGNDFVPMFYDLPRMEDGLWSALAASLTAALAFGVFLSFHRRLHLARQDLHSAYERSESLLRNMLPASIARRLKREETTIADDYEDVSVLFADLVGFTTLAASQRADETVKMLNEIFSAFDQAVAARNLEKIKTIGDAYMVAAGLPHSTPGHTIELLKLAEDMLAIIDEHNETHEQSLQLRIGLCTGPLVAGVIGSKKLSYDIWGDTVNVASRMESTGVPGRIQVTETIVRASEKSFAFEERGMVKVKGRGEIRTFFVAQNESAPSSVMTQAPS